MRIAIRNEVGRLNSGGGGASLTPPTEEELLAYIMANFPPDFFLDPEQGLVDSSGNGVTVTTNGTPTVNASGGLNDRGYIALDGVDDAIVVNRVDIGTHAFVFRHNNTSLNLLNVPTADTGAGDSPKFFKQGFYWSNSDGYYKHLSDSQQPINTGTNIIPSTSWKAFIAKGDGYLVNHGQSVFNTLSTAMANTTVSKMFYGCWGRGDGANLSSFCAYDVGLSMIWNAELSDDNLQILNAYLELRFDSYGKKTYLYKAETLELHSGNPTLSGNANSGSPYNQAYRPTMLPEGQAFYKALPKDIFSSSTVDDFETMVDGPRIINDNTQAWDANGHNVCTIIKDNGVYYLFIGGRNASSQFQIGLATTTDSPPLGNYTKNAGNPVISLSAINTALGTSYVYLAPMSVFRKGSVFHMLIECDTGGAYDIREIILATGSDWATWTTFEKKITGDDVPLKKHTLASSGTTKDDTGYNAYVQAITGGFLVKQSGKLVGLVGIGCEYDNLTIVRGHDLFPIMCEDDGNYNIKVVCSVALISGSLAWSRNMVYLPTVMTEQDGEFMTASPLNDKWLIGFAGLGTTAENVNIKGQSGFAYAPKRIIKNLLP